MPRLNPFDRGKLAKRRLQQAFPSARLTAILPFKKTPHRVLLIGVHETNPVFAWAERLRARLPHIALVPVEGAVMAGRLMPEAADGWAMMVSREKSGGFRQIVTFKNDLVFTRLTPLPPAGSDDDNAEIIARDIKASLDYLSRYGLENSQELSVLLLMPGDIHTSRACKGLPLESIRSLSPANAAQVLRLPFTPDADDSTADGVFAAYLTSKLCASLPLMLPDMRPVWLTRKIREWGLRLSTAFLALAVGGALWEAGDFVATLYEAQKVSVQLGEALAALSQAKASAAPSTAPLGRMRQALERRRIFEQQSETPWHALNAVSRGLDRNVRLVKLDWKTTKGDALENLRVSLQVLSEDTAADRSATVETFMRAAQEVARAMPDYTVTVTKPPYPSLPQETVSTAGVQTEDPVGDIFIQRRAP